MNFSDRFSLSLHRRIADKLRSDPVNTLNVAIANLERWLAKDSFAFGPERRALLEWKKIIEESTAREIESIIISETDEGQRLRSSSPFAGILTRTEQSISWSECAEIGLD
ncbi:MAG: hypothetical protein IT174_07005 [Acidobacteria bacterium]|nr:hypothetical protein [Acidobacteriota bacterium]